MIISRTPYRISLFGGGTDFPNWYEQYGGAVLSTTIDKYCYLTCRYLPPFFDHHIRVVYSAIELCQNVDEIKHPSVRETIRFLNILRGLEIHHDGDLPARSGMASSSAFTVGLLHALHGLSGEIASKRQLANEAIHVEQNLIKETVGSQDQVAVAYGGLNHITFHADGDIQIQPVPLTHDQLQELNDHLMLFFTGIKRMSSDIANSYVQCMDDRCLELRMMRDLVEEGLKTLSSPGELMHLGELLHEGWEIKRSLSNKVSTPQIDQIYQQARSAGALGGKITGAGGGGFLLLFAPPSRQEQIKDRLRNLIHVPFRLEFSGSQVIFLDMENDYASDERERRQRTLKLIKQNK